MSTVPSVDRAPPRAVTAMCRMGPMLFDHAQVAMLTTTDTGVVVEANPRAARLFGNAAPDLVQEPLERHLALVEGGSIAAGLGIVARYDEPMWLGRCQVLRARPPVEMGLVASSAHRPVSRPLLLVQLICC